MKAKVNATGEILDLYPYHSGYWIDLKTQYLYREPNLEFLPDTHEKVIEGWVARDEDGALNIFDREPKRIAECAWAYFPGHSLGFSLPKEYYPEVTWESEPKRVKITITPMEE